MKRYLSRDTVIKIHINYLKGLKMENTRKNEIVKAMTEVTFYPETTISDINETPTFKIPISTLTALGVAIDPLTSAIQTAINGSAGTSGIYYVNTKGMEMFHAKDGSGFIGGLKNGIGGVGGGQARMQVIPFDPTILFLALALMQIEKKLNTIQETQVKILEFLEGEKESKLTGNINFLSEEIGKYKFNYDDPTYINTSLTATKIIRRDASADIQFYRKNIVTLLKNKHLFTKGADIKNKLHGIQQSFKHYQMALYAYAFASYYEILLQKNFKPDNLEHTSKSIRDKSIEYRELYTTCYTSLEELSNSAIGAHLLDGMADINKNASKAIGKVPVLDKFPIDENLLALANKLHNINDINTNKVMTAFLSCRDNYINIFVDNINKVSELYNTPMQIYFDNENIYYCSNH